MSFDKIKGVSMLFGETLEKVNVFFNVLMI